MEIPTGFVDKAKLVRRVFTHVETEYDFLLHVMSLTFDSVWRHRLMSKVDSSREVRVLDLACGTGLVTFDLSRWTNETSTVVGLDLSPAMLRIARRNKLRQPSNCHIEFVRAVGEFLPFRENLFDYVTVGLALRNFANKQALFKESRRVLMLGGWFLSVDFVRPDNPRVWAVYRFHIFQVLPTLGRIVSAHWKWTLIYLASSILISTRPEEVCKALPEFGFRRTFLERMSLGIVALIGAQR
jgi:ubiquinone/menaquinone biosynthesis methyltransferase